MEHDLALGGFAEFINCATYLAQLSKSRSSNHNFKGISTKEAVKRIKKAKGIYSKWKEDNLSDEQIAYKIYERLSSNKASKTVTAQWLSKMLLRYKSKIEHGIKTDEKFKYIVDAIYNVTKPEDADH